MLPEHSVQQKQAFDSKGLENRKMKKASAIPKRRTAWRSGISASEQRNNLSYAGSRPATSVIRRLDKIDDEAEQSTALTDNTRANY